MNAEIIPKENIESLDKLPATPCLVSEGLDILTSTKYRLCIDKTLVENSCEDFKTAFSCLFASYYIFNCRYPKQSEKTLKFIQRYIFGINPTVDNGGSRVLSNTKKGRSVHPAVLKFNQSLVEFLNVVLEEDSI